MKHRWGTPMDPITSGPDESYIYTVPKECFVGVMYCLSCKKTFCEHCLGPNMFDLECEGPGE